MSATADATGGPGRPTGLSWAQEGSDQVRLTWDEPGDVQSGDTYRIVRDGTQVATVPSGTTTWVDPGPLAHDTRYRYTVHTVRGAETSGVAGPVEAVLTDNEPPAPPTSFSAQIGGNGYPLLRWARSVSADVSRYEIWRMSVDPDPSRSGWHPVATLTAAAAEWTDTDPLENEPVRYRIRAVDADGLVVVKGIVHAVLVEPGAGLLHGVAGFDAVQGLAHGHRLFTKSRIRSAASTHSASGATRAMRTRPAPGLTPPTSRDR